MLTKTDKTGFYVYWHELETALKAGKGQIEATEIAAAAYTKATGEPCPFSVVRSCPSCKHFDRGHCHQWAADVPLAETERGCDAHAFVVPNTADLAEPTPF